MAASGETLMARGGIPAVFEGVTPEETRSPVSRAATKLALEALLAEARTDVPFAQAAIVMREENPGWVTLLAQVGGETDDWGELPATDVGIDFMASVPGGLMYSPDDRLTKGTSDLADLGFHMAWSCALNNKGDSHGMVTFLRTSAEPFTPGEEARLQRVSDQCALLVSEYRDEVLRGHDAMRRAAVDEVCRWGDADRPLPQLFEELAPTLAASLSADYVQLAAVTAEGLVEIIGSEPVIHLGPGDVCSWAHSQIDLIIAQRRAVVEYRPSKVLGLWPQAFAAAGIEHVAAALLQRGEDVLGALVVGRRSRMRLGEAESAYLSTVASVLTWVLHGRQREMQLRGMETRYQRLFDEAPVMYVITNDSAGADMVVDCNAMFLETLGYSREDVVGKPTAAFYAGPSHGPAARPQRGRTGGHVREEERSLQAKSGAIIDTVMRSTPEVDEDGQTVGALMMFVDISERKALQDQLAHRAFHDPLTELPNRELFMDRARHAVERNSLDGLLTVVALVDLDDFKFVNDTLGHAAGDELLLEVGARLHGAILAGDTVGRLGGDEFAVLLETQPSEEAAHECLEALLRAFAAPFQVGERQLFVAGSLGYACTRDPAANVADLLRRADAAMYESKRRGKGVLSMFSPELETRAGKRLEVASLLRQSVESEAIDVAYQPIVDLWSGRVLEAEALARWHTTEHGVVPAQEFIPVAEEAGLIVHLGAIVMRRALTDLLRWQAEGLVPHDFKVAVNVSGRQLERASLVEDVLELLDSVGVARGCLTLEVTESVALTEGEHSVAKLRRLRDAGVNIAIDDFGTGYSSLSYLKRLPVDTIKVDRSFVAGLAEDAKDSAIVQAVLAFASGLQLTVTAEGVETEEQAATLRALGCTRAQGYLFGRPMATPAFESSLSRTVRAITAAGDGAEARARRTIAPRARPRTPDRRRGAPAMPPAA